MIVGASFDTPEDNREFRDKQDFAFALLCDTDQAVGAAYGVVRDPGDDFAALPKRMTFLIAPDQTVAKVYDVTDVAAHADEVLADIKQAG